MSAPGMVRRFRLPDGFEPPVELVHEDLRAHALTRKDLDDDVRGINASLDLIRRTRGGPWPTEPVTADFNYVDAVWHECEFRDGKSFTYVLRRADGRYLGCCYLYPIGTRTPLTDDLLVYDVDVSWWVTPEGYDAGFYARAYAALQRWMAESFPFWRAHYSNAEIPGGDGSGERPLGDYTVVGTVDAPPERVFAVFTDPGIFGRWFVVPGFSTPPERIVVDARAGGGVEAVMVAQDGGEEIPFSVTYERFEPPTQVVLRFSDHTEVLTVTLESDGEAGTRCTYHATGTPLSGLDEAARVTEAMHGNLAATLAPLTGSVSR